ncbi:hypothetical protein [Streptomyces sp. NPDC001492]
MARARDRQPTDTYDDHEDHGEFVIRVPRRTPTPRRHRHCGCRRNQSPIVDTFHTPLARWGITVLAILAFVAQMAWPAVALTVAATVAWKHR